MAKWCESCEVCYQDGDAKHEHSELGPPTEGQRRRISAALSDKLEAIWRKSAIVIQSKKRRSVNLMQGIKEYSDSGRLRDWEGRRFNWTKSEWIKRPLAHYETLRTEKEAEDYISIIERLVE